MCFCWLSFRKKGYKVFDIDKNKFLVSRDVVFREDVFPYIEKPPPSATALPVVESCDEDWQFVVPSEDRGSSSVPVSPEPVATDVSVPQVDSVPVGAEDVEISEHQAPVHTEHPEQSDAIFVPDHNDESAPFRYLKNLVVVTEHVFHLFV